MSEAAVETDVRHLWCKGCDEQPTYALIDGNGVLVCHCTHVDGELEPVQVHGFHGHPSRWEYRRTGALN